MRANTKKKHEMGRRFAIVIGVAAAGVMALGAQTGAAASEGVVSYKTRVTAFKLSKVDGGDWHGYVTSYREPNARSHAENLVKKCVVGRKVILFKKRPGPDRKLGATRSTLSQGWGEWTLVAPETRRVYAKVTRKVGDGFVCSADYSNDKNGGS